MANALFSFCFCRSLGSVTAEKKQEKKHQYNGYRSQRCKTEYSANHWFFGSLSNPVHSDLWFHVQRIKLPDWNRRESFHTLNLQFPNVRSNLLQTNVVPNRVNLNQWNKQLGFYNLSSYLPSISNTRQGIVLHPFGVRTFVTTSDLKDQMKTSKPSEVLRAEEKSRVEEAVEAIKEKKQLVKDKAFEYGCSPEDLVPKVEPVIKKSLWEKVKHEAMHYYNGFKLLYFETRIASRLLWQVLNGKTLTRRQRRQVGLGETILPMLFDFECGWFHVLFSNTCM